MAKKPIKRLIRDLFNTVMNSLSGMTLLTDQLTWSVQKNWSLQMFNKDEKAATCSISAFVIIFGIITLIQILQPAVKTAFSLISKFFN